MGWNYFSSHNHNGGSVDVWKWISDFIPHIIIDVSVNSCCDSNKSISVKRAYRKLYTTWVHEVWYIIKMNGMCVSRSDNLDSIVQDFTVSINARSDYGVIHHAVWATYQWPIAWSVKKKTLLIQYLNKKILHCNPLRSQYKRNNTNAPKFDIWIVYT